MGETTYLNLRELRDGMARLRVETVAFQAGLTVERLREIERDDDGTVFEFERLAAVYGLDVETLWQSPIRLGASDGVNVLTSLEEFRDLDDLGRARILRAAASARDLVTMRTMLGEHSVELPRLGEPAVTEEPYRQGASLALALRAKLGLDVRPIESVRDFVADHFPAVSVLYADLTRRGPAGLGFADPHRGPAIVLNTVGKNEHPSVRRFSLCHELCHLLVDWNRSDPMASISGFFQENALDRERRANGFAVRLLCPESVVHGLRHAPLIDAVRVLIGEYGLHYQAARLSLRKDAGIDLPPVAPIELRAVVEPNAQLAQRESPNGHEGFPLERVARERRGDFAQTVMRAWRDEKISRDAAARYLGVTPTEPIERVADYFDIDLPAELATG